MQDRRRLRWDRCCVELRQLGANSYQSALRGEACNKVLHRTLGGFEQVEGRMRRLIYQLDDKDQQARWGEEMAVVFRFLCFAIAALWRTDRVADRFS